MGLAIVWRFGYYPRLDSNASHCGGKKSWKKKIFQLTNAARWFKLLFLGMMKADKFKAVSNVLARSLFLKILLLRFRYSESWKWKFFDKLTVGAICLKQRGVTTWPYSRLVGFCPKTIFGVLTVRFRSDIINIGFSLRERDFKLIPNCQDVRPFGGGLSTIQIEEFDPGSEWTLAAWLRHASRTDRLIY